MPPVSVAKGLFIGHARAARDGRLRLSSRCQNFPHEAVIVGGGGVSSSVDAGAGAAAGDMLGNVKPAAVC